MGFTNHKIELKCFIEIQEKINVFMCDLCVYASRSTSIRFTLFFFVPAYILLIHKYLDEGYSHTHTHSCTYLLLNLYLFCAKVNNKSIHFYIYYLLFQIIKSN